MHDYDFPTYLTRFARTSWSSSAPDSAASLAAVSSARDMACCAALSTSTLYVRMPLHAHNNSVKLGCIKYIESVCIFLSILGPVFVLPDRRFCGYWKTNRAFPRPVTVLKKLRKARTTYGNMSFQIPWNSSDRPWQRVGSSFIFIGFACESQQSTNPSMWRCLQAKRETAYGEKPEAVKTHLRNMVIVPLGQQSDKESHKSRGAPPSRLFGRLSHNCEPFQDKLSLYTRRHWIEHGTPFILITLGTTKYGFLSARVGRRW